MTYSVFPTTVIGPSYPVEIVQTPKILKVDFGDGYTSEGADGINYNLKVFNLSWDVLTSSETSTIINFIEGCGGYQTFQWTYDSVTYLVKCRQWAKYLISPQIYKVTAKFEQVPI